MNDKMGDNFKSLYGQDMARPPEKIERRRFRGQIRAAIRLMLLATLILELVIIQYHCKFVKLKQAIFAQGSRIEVEYQRRNNLIPRLVEIAREYALHEKKLMRYVADARALKKHSQKLTGVMGESKKAEVERIFSRLIALAEQYPDLKAEKSYHALMAKIVITENRIALEREMYVSLINDHNSMVQLIPHRIFAKFFKVKPMDMYAPKKNPMPGKTGRFFFIY